MAEIERTRDLRLVLEHNLGIPFTEGNGVGVLPADGEAPLATLIDAIRHAWHTVDLCTFDLPAEPGRAELTAALIERARAGVRIRVLLDALGGRDAAKRFAATCAAERIELAWFRRRALPASGRGSYRCQRRILVVDNLVAFTGGAGVAGAGASAGHDVQLRVQGPAVRGLAGAFGQLWAEAAGPGPSALLDPFEQPAAGNAWCQVIRGSAGLGQDDLATVARVLIALATKQIRIVTPYLADEPAWIEDIALAVRDGVGVDVVLPGRPPPRRLAPPTAPGVIGKLIQAQAMVWSYESGLIHSSLMIIDEVAALVGATGLGRTGEDRDEEVALCLLDHQVVAQLGRRFNEGLWSSRRM